MFHNNCTYFNTCSLSLILIVLLLNHIIQFDPDTDRTPEEIVKEHGLQFEIHEIHTKDKYILTQWRIYNASDNYTRTPVLL